MSSFFPSSFPEIPPLMAGMTNETWTHSSYVPHYLLRGDPFASRLSREADIVAAFYICIIGPFLRLEKVKSTPWCHLGDLFVKTINMLEMRKDWEQFSVELYFFFLPSRWSRFFFGGGGGAWQGMSWSQSQPDLIMGDTIDKPPLSHFPVCSWPEMNFSECGK